MIFKKRSANGRKGYKLCAFIAMVAASAIVNPLFAKDYYVDANNGNDDWDGTADYEHRDETINKGPRKTLVGGDGDNRAWKRGCGVCR